MYQRNCNVGFTESDRRLVRRCRRWIGATLIVYFILNGLLTRHPPGVRGELLAALMGVVFFTLMLLFGTLIAASGDEFRRALLVRSLLWATLVTMFGACVLGYMEAFSDTRIHVPLLILPGFLICATAIAKVFIFRRHSVGHEESAA